MSGDKAIRFNSELPTGYQKMVNVMCDFCAEGHVDCGAALRIIHEEGTADMARAKKQLYKLMTILREEHSRGVGPDVHQQVYDLGK